MSAKRRPSLPPMPDLDHLTEEERKIIESVIQRQREEEEKEQEILRSVMSLRPSQIRICVSPGFCRVRCCRLIGVPEDKTS